jgi:hypothetical protein
MASNQGSRIPTLVAAVKAHAAANYSTGGWDYIAECYSDDDLILLIGRAHTPKGAIKNVAQTAKIHQDHVEDLHHA